MEDFLEKRRDKVIVSTCFESPFGYEAVVRLSSNSMISPGLERSCFQGLSVEFCAHHNSVLSSPAVSVKELDKLWDLLAK